MKNARHLREFTGAGAVACATDGNPQVLGADRMKRLKKRKARVEALAVQVVNTLLKG